MWGPDSNKAEVGEVPHHSWRAALEPSSAGASFQSCDGEWGAGRAQYT